MLTAARNTRIIEGTFRVLTVAAGATIHAGALVANDGGFAVPGTVANDLTALGRADADAAAGEPVTIRSGTFGWKNSVADPVTAAAIGKPVFIEDDETVSLTDGGGTRSAAGVCFTVEGQQIFVTT